jgi:class 3 adenylate cyclase
VRIDERRGADLLRRRDEGAQDSSPRSCDQWALARQALADELRRLSRRAELQQLWHAGAVPRPFGTVTFLFTDIEGSTRLWEQAPEAMASALADHDQIVRAAVDAHGGHVFATGGDGFAVAFSLAADALAAAEDVARGLARHRWPNEAAIKARMGLHTGEVIERRGDYLGPAVNRASRHMAIAHGGQIVCSQATARCSRLRRSHRRDPHNRR